MPVDPHDEVGQRHDCITAKSARRRSRMRSLAATYDAPVTQITVDGRAHAERHVLRIEDGRCAGAPTR
jgi:hypothetical protein